MSANDNFSLHDDEELSLHDDASLNGSVPASNKGDAPAKPPQIITTNTLSNIKLPVLQKDDYDTWAMEMEHYLEYIDNEVWKVIQNGNSKKRVTKGKDGVYRVLLGKLVNNNKHIIASPLGCMLGVRWCEVIGRRENIRRGWSERSKIWEEILVQSGRSRKYHDVFEVPGIITWEVRGDVRNTTSPLFTPALTSLIMIVGSILVELKIEGVFEYVVVV
ncbi:hypothetical protein Tco_1319927 [Tanacetum coccineum]